MIMLLFLFLHLFFNSTMLQNFFLFLCYTEDRFSHHIKLYLGQQFYFSLNSYYNVIFFYHSFAKCVFTDHIIRKEIIFKKMQKPSINYKSEIFIPNIFYQIMQPLFGAFIQKISNKSKKKMLNDTISCLLCISFLK